MSDPGAEFWAFSLGFYGRPGVSPALITFQDDKGLDVNIALYCCWCGLSGRPALTHTDLAQAETSIASWRRDVIEPLRSVRRVLKGSPVAGSTEIRAAVQKQELEGERIAQTLLAANAGKPDAAIPLDERRKRACANLRLYVGSGEATSTIETAVLSAS